MHIANIVDAAIDAAVTAVAFTPSERKKGVVRLYNFENALVGELPFDGRAGLDKVFDTVHALLTVGQLCRFEVKLK